MASAFEVARTLAAGSATAVRFTKHALNNWLRLAGPSFDTSLALEFLGFRLADVREGWPQHGVSALRTLVLLSMTIGMFRRTSAFEPVLGVDAPRARVDSARASALDAAPCVCEQCLLSAQLRRRRRTSGRFAQPCRPRPLPVHHQGGSARGISLRLLRRAHGADCANSRLIRHHRQTDGRRVYPKRHHDLEQSGRAVDSRSRRAARDESSRGVWLWLVHGRPRRPLRRGSRRLHRHSHVGRSDGKAGAADNGFSRRKSS